MVYSLQEKTERGSAQGLIREIDPVFLEIAEQILKEGERIFEKIDWNILFPWRITSPLPSKESGMGNRSAIR